MTSTTVPDGAMVRLPEGMTFEMDEGVYLKLPEGTTLLFLLPDEWIAHRERTNLCVTMLAAVMAALASSPFGSMIGPDIRAEIDRVMAL